MKRFKRLLPAATLFAAIVLLGCDPSQGVTFVNRTGEAITVYEAGDIIGMIQPNEQKTFSFGEFDGQKLFEARDANGFVLLSERLSWQNLRDRDWRIVVEEAR